jgi:hypothetical protein
MKRFSEFRVFRTGYYVKKAAGFPGSFRIRNMHEKVITKGNV